MERFVLIDSEKRQILVMSSAVFIEKSLKFIQSMMITGKLSQERGRRYIKEILHSIFFIGYINKLAIHPVNVLRVDLHSKLSEKFPDVFQSYGSRLPHRPPFSVLLEVVVETTGDRDVSDVLRVLENLNNNMVVPGCRNNIFDNVFCLGASVVSFCCFKDRCQKTQRYFGASVGCKGKKQKTIFIDLACIQTWNRHVAHAVCLADEHNKSIALPTTVFSAASRVRGKSVHQYKPVPPCLQCCTLFPSVKFLPVPEANPPTPYWEYGNCAECEAISNLLNAEIRVNELTRDLNTSLVPSLQTLLPFREERLRQNLRQCQFDINQELRFYNPE